MSKKVMYQELTLELSDKADLGAGEACAQTHVWDSMVAWRSAAHDVTQQFI